MKVCFSIYGNDVNKCTIIDKSWTISFAVYTSFHFKDISKRGSFVFFSVNLYNTCMVLCFQVWPTVCWPLCHPGTDSSLPSSPSSFTFSLAPLGTSQWVRPICAVCCECVSLYPCPGLTNLLSPLSLSFCLSMKVRSQSCVWWSARWSPGWSQTTVRQPTSRVLKASLETNRECWWLLLWPSSLVSCRWDTLTNHNRSDCPQMASTAK